MIGFPDGGDGAGDQIALPPGARTKSQQVPNASAEVGPTRQRVDVQGEEDGARGPRFKFH